jgi:REP element-mobilizing transposase RayT
MERLFGEIIAGRMISNEFGKIAFDEWQKSAQIRKNLIIDEFIIMPNHMHGIIQIIDEEKARAEMKEKEERAWMGIENARAGNEERKVRSYSHTTVLSGNGPASSGNGPASSGNGPASFGNGPASSGDEPASSCEANNQDSNAQSGAIFRSNIEGNPKFRSPSKNIGAIVRGYKGAVTTRINTIRKMKGTPVWHRNYYEHIIRNDRALNNIRNYIRHNPQKWDSDRFR